MNSESLFTKCGSCSKDVSKSAKVCPNCGSKLKKLSIIHWVGIAIVCLIVVSVINAPETSNVKEVENISPKSIKEKALNDIALKYSWSKEGFGSIMEADLFIKNNSDYDVKDIEVECNHYAKSGTKIDSNNRTIYEIIKSKSSKKYPNYNMGFIHEQAYTSTCFIKNIGLVNH
mgnify:CR=1 FL=1